MEAAQAFLQSLLGRLGDNPVLRYAVIGAGLILASMLAYTITRRVLVRLITFLVKKTTTQWDDILIERGVLRRISWLSPALVFYYAAFQFEGQAEAISQRLVIAYMQIVMITVVTSLLSGVGDIWATTKRAKSVPIKGYLQVAKLVITLIGGIIVFGGVINRSPWGLLSGLGAATAIILLVFKDTILSFVASIQIASTGVIRLGDWLSMPKYGADGDVIDIALHRVTVQNWDKTLTAIPTHKFLDESFKNWRGMSESGGRRIMRSVKLDQTSVHFLSDDEIEKLAKIQVLTPYITEAKAKLQAFNTEHEVDESVPVNGRRLTNLGTFRAYLQAYMKQHTKIHQDMTLLVRQLTPSPEGIGIEIYAFTNDIAWANYEAIQADIFDHVLASLPEFGLRVFQNPTGADFRALAERA